MDELLVDILFDAARPQSFIGLGAVKAEKVEFSSLRATS